MSVPSKDARFLPAPEVRYRSTPSGGMLVNLSTGACFELNRSGADLWSRLAEGASLAVAIDTVQRKYAVSADVLESDALRLCSELLRAGLVTGGGDGPTS